jgi:hypothetical protein
VFRQDGKVGWQARGSFNTGACAAATEALAKGDAHAAPPDRADLEVGGRRFRMFDDDSCAELAPAKR